MALHLMDHDAVAIRTLFGIMNHRGESCHTGCELDFGDERWAVEQHAVDSMETSTGAVPEFVTVP